MQCAIVCWCRIFECCHGWCTCCLRWRLWKMQLVFQAAHVSWTCEINVTGLRRWNLRKAAGLCEITACIWPTTASTRSLPTTSRQYCHLCLSVIYFFGYVARSDFRQDYNWAISASRQPPGDWRRPRVAHVPRSSGGLKLMYSRLTLASTQPRRRPMIVSK